VHRITDRGDVRVQFNHETRWTFHPGALTKLPRASHLGFTPAQSWLLSAWTLLPWLWG
ncbi:MIB E3 ubiquitin protein ligase 2, partial [Homo sapiens]